METEKRLSIPGAIPLGRLQSAQWRLLPTSTQSQHSICYNHMTIDNSIVSSVFNLVQEPSISDGKLFGIRMLQADLESCACFLSVRVTADLSSLHVWPGLYGCQDNSLLFILPIGINIVNR